MDEEISRALEGKKGKKETHTHGVHYERADNGGFRAHVTKHHGKGPRSEGHSHHEEHVLASHKDAMAHMKDEMGDQPDAGELQQQAEPGQDPAAGGEASPSPAPGMPGQAA